MSRSLTTILENIEKMEKGIEVKLSGVTMNEDAITYDAFDENGKFITHVEVQFDNGKFNGRVLKCIPFDSDYDDMEWNDVKNENLRSFISNHAAIDYIIWQE